MALKTLTVGSNPGQGEVLFFFFFFSTVMLHSPSKVVRLCFGIDCWPWNKIKIYGRTDKLCSLEPLASEQKNANTKQVF